MISAPKYAKLGKGYGTVTKAIGEMWAEWDADDEYGAYVIVFEQKENDVDVVGAYHGDDAAYLVEKIEEIYEIRVPPLVYH